MPAKLIEFNLAELLDPNIEKCSPPTNGIYLNAPSGTIDSNPTLFIHSAQDPEEAGYQYIQIDPQVNQSSQEFSITATPNTTREDLISFSTPGEGERVRIDADGNIHAYGDVILHGEATAIRADEVEPEYRDLSSWFDRTKEGNVKATVEQVLTDVREVLANNNLGAIPTGMVTAMAAANASRDTISRDVAERQLNFYREMIGEN